MKQPHYKEAVLVRLTGEQKAWVAREAITSGRRYGHFVRDLVEAERRRGYDLCPSCKTMFPHGKSCGCGGK